MRRTWTIARRLRKAATEAELKLWQGLRGRSLDGLRFRRHLPIGGFLAEFACVEARLVIELDGGQHWDLAEHVAVRTQKLELCGYRVLRFWGHAVLLHPEEVFAEIRRQAHATLAGAHDDEDTHAPFDFDFGLKGCEEPALAGAA
jgi:very-short-patch-repair endonuclease